MVDNALRCVLGSLSIALGVLVSIDVATLQVMGASEAATTLGSCALLLGCALYRGD